MKNGEPLVYVLRKDLVIPAGTEFTCIDGTTRRYATGNYEAIIGLSKDSTGSLVYGVEDLDPKCMEWFEVKP